MPDSGLVDWILSGLAPSLKTGEERPPEREDYLHHVTDSLEILRRTESCITADTIPSIVLLCSQHSSEELPWSSAEHSETAHRLLSVIEERSGSLGALLSQAEGKVFKTLLSHLQSSLENFILEPGSVRSVVWLTQQVTDPESLDLLVPLLLPHLLHWLDCWLPHYKLEGCQLSRHIANHSSPSQLIFYGRAEVLTEPLTRLTASQEVAVARAAGEALLSLTIIRHDSRQAARPGQADLFIKTLISSLELSSQAERQEVYCGLIRDTVPVLGRGAARWVSLLSTNMISLLDTSPPPSVFSILSLLASQCPECLARETSPLLSSLFKLLYRLSLEDEERGEMLSDVRECIEAVARCDVDTARLMCLGLQQETVNNTFDTLTASLLSDLNI